MEGLKERNPNVSRVQRRSEKTKTHTKTEVTGATVAVDANNTPDIEEGPQSKPKVGLDEEEMLFLARRCLAEELMTRPSRSSILSEPFRAPIFQQVSPIHPQGGAVILPQWTIVQQHPTAAIPDRIYHPHQASMVPINAPVFSDPIPVPIPVQEPVRGAVAVAQVDNIRRNNRLFQLHRLGVGLVILKFGWVWVSCGGLILMDSVFCTSDVFVLVYKRLKDHVFQVGSRISASAKETVKLFSE